MICSDFEIKRLQVDMDEKLEVADLIVVTHRGDKNAWINIKDFIESLDSCKSQCPDNRNGVLISMKGPNWAYLILIEKWLENAPWIAIHYPQINGYIIVRSKNMDILGKKIKLDKNNIFNFDNRINPNCSANIEINDFPDFFGEAKEIKITFSNGWISPENFIRDIDNVMKDLDCPDGVVFDMPGSPWGFAILDHYTGNSRWAAIRTPQEEHGYIVTRSKNPRPVIGEGFTVNNSHQFSISSDKKKADVFAVIGPPHSGKSVLVDELYHSLKKKNANFYLVRVCPDGEGMWSLATYPEKMAELRKKGKFTEEFIKSSIDRISNLSSQPDFDLVIVDCGGKISSANEQILNKCDYIIFLCNETDLPAAENLWMEFFSKTNSKIAARFISILLDKKPRNMWKYYRSDIFYDEDENISKGIFYNLSRTREDPERYLDAVSQLGEYLLRKQSESFLKKECIDFKLKVKQGRISSIAGGAGYIL